MEHVHKLIGSCLWNEIKGNAISNDPKNQRIGYPSVERRHDLQACLYPNPVCIPASLHLTFSSRVSRLPRH